jgi:hypothetical protein
MTRPIAMKICGADPVKGTTLDAALVFTVPVVDDTAAVFAGTADDWVIELVIFVVFRLEEREELAATLDVARVDVVIAGRGVLGIEAALELGVAAAVPSVTGTPALAQRPSSTVIASIYFVISEMLLIFGGLETCWLDLRRYTRSQYRVEQRRIAERICHKSRPGRSLRSL